MAPAFSSLTVFLISPPLEFPLIHDQTSVDADRERGKGIAKSRTKLCSGTRVRGLVGSSHASVQSREWFARNPGTTRQPG
ncbi:MAG: hypothetical protein UW94_C0012G0031 [Parcubacteria group bacterium GW2011_GWA2_45_14]|nr:MAG: hypothetical protein UW94_C0012G0031 [Parcubacteria group bacterium GW2011_GWA2_45_14]